MFSHPQDIVEGTARPLGPKHSERDRTRDPDRPHSANPVGPHVLSLGLGGTEGGRETRGK